MFPSTIDHPQYGDRRMDRRRSDDARVKRHRDRRRTYPGNGRDSRKGHCRECGEKTDSVVTWGENKVANLCPPCGKRIRETL